MISEVLSLHTSIVSDEDIACYVMEADAAPRRGHSDHSRWVRETKHELSTASSSMHTGSGTWPLFICVGQDNMTASSALVQPAM